MLFLHLPVIFKKTRHKARGVKMNKEPFSMEVAELFLHDLVIRGLGIYGLNRISLIARSSGIVINDDNTISVPKETAIEALESFIQEYASLSRSARLTVILLAKKHGITLSGDLRIQKRAVQS